MKRTLLTLAAALLLATPATAETMKTVSGFAETASMGNMFEVKASKLALKQSSNDQVRAFAQMMVNDHTMAENNLRKALGDTATNSRILPEDLDGKHKVAYEKQISASYENFDRVYLNNMIDGHREAMAAYEEYARVGDNPALRTYAQNTLPHLREHAQKLDIVAANTMMPSRDTKKY